MSDLQDRIDKLSPEKRRLLQKRMQARGISLPGAGQRLAPRSDFEGPIPLSYAQQRLWFLQQLAPDNVAYNNARVLRLRGPLDTTALRRALDAMLARHEILRTTYRSEDSGPVQVVHPAGAFPLERIDLEDRPPDAREAAFLAHHEKATALPFDLATDFPVRARLYRLDAEDHVFVREHHHIATDHWSSAIFRRELDELYAAFSRGAAPELPPLPVQYADYALWQREQLVGPDAEAHLTYWREQLEVPPPLELPTDAPRPPAQTFAGAVCRQAIDPAVLDGLQALARRGGTTLFTVLLAAFKVLAARLSGQTDILVGSPVAGRVAPELEPMIGMFLNTLVLRSRLDGAPTFLEALDRVRKTTLEAFTHQSVPFELLLEALQPARDLSRTPFFQVFFNMASTPVARREEFPGLDTEELRLRAEHAVFDLTVYVRDHAGGREIAFLYNPDLFSAARMEAMLSQYLSLLSQVVETPDQDIHRYNLAITGDLPDPSAPLSEDWHGPIHARLADWARRSPDAPAVISRKETWTYVQLDRRSNALAQYLVGDGFRKGDRIAILGERIPELVQAVMGVFKAGGAYTILDPAYPELRLQAILEQAAPRGLIVLAAPGSAVRAFAASHDLPVIDRETLAGMGEAAAPPGMEIGPEDIAVIGFTSGSTGAPKGVLSRHGPLTHFYPWMQARFGLGPEDRFSMISGLAHDPLQRDIFTALWAGAAICVPEQETIETPGALAEWLTVNGVSFAHLTPAMGQVLGETQPGRDLQAALRWVFFVGDRLTRGDVMRLRRLAPRVGVINAYGSTETQRAVSMHVLDPGQELPPGHAVLPLGQGIPGVQLVLRNPAGALCGVGELGEITVRSPHLAAGYLDDPALTAARFGAFPDSYRTGDLGRYLPDGTVVFAGRADRQVKLRGFRVEPAEIEKALLDHAAVREAAVVLRDGLAGGAGLAAYLVPAVPEGIRDHVRRILPEYMVPAVFFGLENLPLTPNGKLDVAALPLAGGTLPEAAGTGDAPRDDFERGVAESLETLLGVSALGRTANFFDLGGHSLLAIRFFADLERRFGRRLPLATLFRHATVAGLAAVLRGEVQGAADTLVPIQPQGGGRPFFCVHGFGGGVVGYAELARLLGREQPFYGLQARGMDGVDEPDTDVETMAARYIEAIRAVQPEGPYRLGGYCYGGVVAFEMARQLRNRGQETELVAIFEGYAPLRGGRRERVWSSPELLRQYLRNMPYWWRDFVSLGVRGMWARVRRILHRTRRRVLRRLGRETPVNLAAIIDEDAAHIPDIHRRLMEIHVRAMMAYAPDGYPGKVDLFRVAGRSLSRTPSPDNGWGKLAAGGVDVHMVAGQHNNLLEPPHVESLVQALGGVLKSSRGS